MIEKSCLKCSSRFNTEKKAQRYCSIRCGLLGKAKSWKGGRSINHAGYVMLRDKEHPSNRGGYVFEHRVVMEKQIGRFLLRTEVVHHINEIRTDNRIENLQLLGSKADHLRLHADLRKQKVGV